MIVCICKRVSDRQIRSSVEGGAVTLEAIGRACGAGTGCGACHEHIQGMIDHHAPNRIEISAACSRCELSPHKVLSPYQVPGKAA